MQENKMGVMPVNKLLLNMSIPMVISMLVQALYNIVDSIFVAQISENALTAVSLAFPVQNLMISVAAGTGTGVNALLSRSLGEKRQDLVNKSAQNGIFLAILSFLFFGIFGPLCAGLFYSVQTTDGEIISYGIEYMAIVCGASFGIFGQIIFERLLQATGKTLYSMFMQGAGAIINLILDPILIFGLFGMPRMGVAGAAIATVIGQIVAAVLGLIFNRKVNHEIKLEFKGVFRPCREIIGRIYKVGVPSIIMQSITSVLTFAMNLILTGFSTTATAVFGVYFKLNSFLFMPIFGMNNGLIPILAYNRGAAKIDRVVKTMRLGMRYAIGAMLIGLVIFQVWPRQLLGMFNASEDMLAIGIPALRIISLSFVFAGFSIICSTVFQAVGNPMHSLIMSVARQLVVLLPVAWLLSLTGNLDAVWWSYPIAEVASFLISVIFLRKTMKSIKA